MYPSSSQIPTNSFVIQDGSGSNQVQLNITFTDPVDEVPAPSLNEGPLLSGTQKLQDELEKTGSKIKQHEDNLKFLKSQKNQLDGVILDLQVSLGKYVSSNAVKGEDDNSVHDLSEEGTVQQILKHEQSAAATFLQLKSQHGLELSNPALAEDVIGIVATLGKVDDDNLSRLFSEYLGLQTMLAIVCKTFEGVKALEMYDREGLAKKCAGIHELGASLGRALNGRFLVICLDNLRSYPGEILADDPQRRLDFPKPRLPNGDIPSGFLGYAVNMIHVDRTHLYCVTSRGHGLRETLFYNLFSRIQVYRTRAEMFLARPFISDGAVSLDGGMIKASGVLSLGNRGEIDVRFPKSSRKSVLDENFYEVENQMKQKKWERERVVEDIRREQALLDQEKYNFQWQKENFIRFLADSSAVVAQHQMQSAGQNRARQP